jgi:hypothetical protein
MPHTGAKLVRSGPQFSIEKKLRNGRVHYLNTSPVSNSATLTGQPIKRNCWHKAASVVALLIATSTQLLSTDAIGTSMTRALPPLLNFTSNNWVIALIDLH